ncbi:TauD/TfdA dioxygenase family protein [Xenophilus azovorans]|uniref:TauD/TfdA dioxygenase family protein n=1 Tax=Xenophilus azovorans TaxID=151755 RepID=UPI00069241DD|nr:TauD/TfdA family dioxygenase [Xenophilus azovorans]
MITVQSLGRTFVGSVTGVALETITPEQFAQVEAAFHQHAVLVFRGQRLSDEGQLRFSRMFGPLQKRSNYARDRERLTSDEMMDISNIDADGKLFPPDARQRAMNMGDRLWHTDGTFQQIPSLISLLYAHEVAPEGGNTEFADMRAAYDALSPERKAEYEPLVLEHDLFRSREQVGFQEFNPDVRALRPPAKQVLVRRHERTGRRSLYLASHATRVVGRGLEEGRALLQQLIEEATRPEFVHAHPWQPGDLVMWDNRCTMHRARPFDDLRHRRVMQRTTVIDTENSVDRALREGRSLLLEEELSRV